ncbi:putative protein S-acyltransferase 22 [Curcuma longa]|uniref:putative protein S-acyltransferase 22 n=1 Tax=Curcuma longa TaxID=136217 RepID=UPI003D9E040F
MSVPPEIGSPANHTNKKIAEEPVKRRNPGTVKINPWALARLNAEEVSKAAAQARKRSKILQPVRRETPQLQEQETESNVGSANASASGRMTLRSDNRKRINKRGRVPVDLPLEPLAKISVSATDSNASDLALETSTSLAPLRLEARNAFRPSMPMSLTRAVSSSPESSLDSPDLHPFRISSSGMNSFSALGNVPPKGIQLSRSTSDGYEASGGEDSDRIPSRIVHRSSNWARALSLVPNIAGQIADDLKSYTRQQ